MVVLGTGRRAIKWSGVSTFQSTKREMIDQLWISGYPYTRTKNLNNLGSCV